MSETLLLVAGGIVFLLAGAGIGYLVASMRLQARVAEADEVRQKFDAYRRDVTEHFGRTAEHFQAIGKQYKELYDHLSSGADSFCDTETLRDKLDYEPAAAITTAAAADEETPSERPRDYAEGEYADDNDNDRDVEAATEATEAAVTLDEPPEQATRKKTSAEEDTPHAPSDTGAEDKLAADASGDAAEADTEDATDAVDDLKPEVKSDADEDKPQPTLH